MKLIQQKAPFISENMIFVISPYVPALKNSHRITSCVSQKSRKKRRARNSLAAPMQMPKTTECRVCFEMQLLQKGQCMDR